MIITSVKYIQLCIEANEQKKMAKENKEEKEKPSIIEILDCDSGRKLEATSFVCLFVFVWYNTDFTGLG